MSDEITIRSTQEKIADAVIIRTRNLSEVSNLLMDQMKKVQKDPSEIAVSEAMCGLATKVIDVAKTQIAAAALLVNANGTR